MTKITNCVLAGVGGQGILLASSIISRVAMSVGLDVKTNEVHGMAQRGGSVLAQIRFGKEVFSPMVKRGTVDYLIALEIVEALRYADYLSPGGLVLASTQRIVPITVSTGAFKYPDVPEKLLKERFPNVVLCPCLEIAERLGEPRAANVVMIGLFSKFIPLSEQVFIEAMKKLIKPKYLEVNKRAFRAGREFDETC